MKKVSKQTMVIIENINNDIFNKKNLKWPPKTSQKNKNKKGVI
jgi:hypothetical protein